MASVVEITSPQALQSYRLAWNALWLQSPRRCFTQSFDWFNAYWKAAAGDRQLRVLLVQSEGRPIGLLPLASSLHCTRLGAVRLWASACRAREAQAGAIGPSPTATYTAAMRYVQQRRSEWDLLELGPFTESGQVSRCRTALQWHSLYRSETKQVSHLVTDLRVPLPAEAAWVGDLRRSFSQQGSIELQHYAPQGMAQGEGEPCWELFDQCAQIEASHIQSGHEIESISLLHESRRQFSLETFAAAVKQGQLDLGLLKVGSLPVAYWYGYRNEESLHCLALRRRAGVRWEHADQLLGWEHLKQWAQRGMGSCRLLSGVEPIGCPWQWQPGHSYQLQARSCSMPQQILNRWERWYRAKLTRSA